MRLKRVVDEKQKWHSSMGGVEIQSEDVFEAISGAAIRFEACKSNQCVLPAVSSRTGVGRNETNRALVAV